MKSEQSNQLLASLEASDFTVKVNNISKCYKLYDTMNDRIKQTLAGNKKKFYREFWALKNVSFTLHKGETVGVVGKNGSGKSTLLQLICGILTPTSGLIQTKGKIAALLELGTGFNPEFTGHENIYMNAALLGLKRQDIDRLYNSILNFADIGSCINQAVKTYSSGMLVRLAFAVATSTTPDILIVDEALAVGDEYFQKKCYGRIRELQAEGCTIIFVSHAIQNIISFCNKAILIDEGELLACGEPKIITNIYQQLTYASAETKKDFRRTLKISQQRGNNRDAEEMAKKRVLNAEKRINDISLATEIENNTADWLDSTLARTPSIIFENNGASINSAQISNKNSQAVNILRKGDEYLLSCNINLSNKIANAHLAAMLKTAKGINVSGIKIALVSEEAQGNPCHDSASMKASLKFKCLLNPGLYFFNLSIFGIVEGSETYAARIIDAIGFKVIDKNAKESTGIVDIFNSTRVTRAT